MTLKQILHALTTMDCPDYGLKWNLIFMGFRITCGVIALYIILRHAGLFLALASLLAVAWGLPYIVSFLNQQSTRQRHSSKR